MGFSQESVRTLLELSDGHLTSCGEVKAIASEHLQVIRSRIEKLKRLEAILAATLAKCSGGKVPSCPVIDTLAESLSVEQ